MSNEHQKSESKTQITVALIGAAALIIAAFIGLAVHQGGSGRSSGGGSASSTTPSGKTIKRSSSTPMPSPTPSGSVSLVWQHRIRFPYETGLHLSDNQPNVLGMVSADFATANYGDISIPAFSLQVGKAGTVSKPYPTFNECVNSFVSEAQGESVSTQVGQSVCFESDDGSRVAAVTVLAWDKNSFAMRAYAKVWRVNSGL